ncbi:hypothetical protein I546_3919 [Mycobacterium kansasii 732]|nr:hypothetical protein I546_3919 [Mycobacterium kansasii 732]
MGLLFRLLELLVLAAPVIGVIYAGIRMIASVNKRREAPGDPVPADLAGPAPVTSAITHHAGGQFDALSMRMTTPMLAGWPTSSMPPSSSTSRP